MNTSRRPQPLFTGESSSRLAPAGSAPPGRRGRGAPGDVRVLDGEQAFGGGGAAPFEPDRSPTRGSKQVVIAFRSGEAVAHHPELKGYLRDGWRVTRALPHRTDEGTRLMVILG